MRTGLFKLLCALALAAALCACAEGARDQLETARQALAGADYAEAIGSANDGLAAEPDDVTRWGLELVILEAHARAGEGAATKAQLVELATTYPQRISAADFSSTAQLLQAADQKPVAIEVLDLGIKRFPDDAMLAKLIEAAAATGNDPAELEMLRSLGYIE